MLNKRQLGDRLAFGKIPAYCRYELFMERYRSAAEIARRELGGRHAPATVLDVGSGRGRLKYFLDFSDAIEWHGVEVLDEMMRLCADLGYRMHRHDIDAGPLPFEDGAFDLVACLHVLEHVARPADAVLDMARVLRRGGLLVLGMPIKPPGIAGLAAAYYRVRRWLPSQRHRTANAFSLGSARGFARRVLGDSFAWVDVRGFRLFSARRRLPLEDWRWFHAASVWFGRRLPALTPEINIVLRKR